MGLHEKISGESWGERRERKKQKLQAISDQLGQYALIQHVELDDGRDEFTLPLAGVLSAATSDGRRHRRALRNKLTKAGVPVDNPRAFAHSDPDIRATDRFALLSEDGTTLTVAVPFDRKEQVKNAIAESWERQVPQATLFGRHVQIVEAERNQNA